MWKNLERLFNTRAQPLEQKSRKCRRKLSPAAAATPRFGFFFVCFRSFLEAQKKKKKPS